MARSARLESGFQDRIVKKLKELFPGCMVFKMDQIQGIPDLLILHGSKWASLECKQSAKARRQPNQEYYHYNEQQKAVAMHRTILGVYFQTLNRLSASILGQKVQNNQPVRCSVMWG